MPPLAGVVVGVVAGFGVVVVAGFGAGVVAGFGAGVVVTGAGAGVVVTGAGAGVVVTGAGAGVAVVVTAALCAWRAWRLAWWWVTGLVTAAAGVVAGVLVVVWDFEVPPHPAIASAATTGAAISPPRTFLIDMGITPFVLGQFCSSAGSSGLGVGRRPVVPEPSPGRHNASMQRCFGDGDALYERYHDEEWGFPVLDERGLFEKLSLEAFQSGLSWRTILRKRDAFRTAFADFEPDALARFGDADVERRLADAGIVRNRAKIEATLANARATVALRAGGESLDAVIRSHAPPPRPAPSGWSDVPSTTPESVALAKELKRRAFRFVGPTTLYALMQACGLVNDHLATCPAREGVERARRAAGLRSTDV